MNRKRDRFISTAWMVAVALAIQTTALLGQEQTEQRAALQQVPPPLAMAQQIQPTPEQIGDSLMAHQRYQAAIEEYRKAVPDSISALNKMGVAYQLMFNNEEAAKCYRAAIKRDPKNAVAWNNMGSIYMSQKLYSTAERTYKKTVKLDSKSALFRKNLGTALLSERKYKKGWQAYQEALAIDPNIFTHSGSIRIENPSSVQDRGAMNFYMAKGCVKAGLTDKAIYYLRLALNEGFTTPKKVMADAELATLHDNPQFQEMMAAQGVYLNGDPSSARSAVRQ